jgi:hypothetical protein
MIAIFSLFKDGPVTESSFGGENLFFTSLQPPVRMEGKNDVSTYPDENV